MNRTACNEDISEAEVCAYAVVSFQHIEQFISVGYVCCVLDSTMCMLGSKGSMLLQGTLFILTKSGGIVDDLLVAVRDGEEDMIMALIQKLEPSPAAPARSDIIAGKWRLKWNKQAEDANPLQKALIGQVCVYAVRNLGLQGCKHPSIFLLSNTTMDVFSVYFTISFSPNNSYVLALIAGSDIERNMPKTTVDVLTGMIMTQ